MPDNTVTREEEDAGQLKPGQETFQYYCPDCDKGYTTCMFAMDGTPECPVCSEPMEVSDDMHDDIDEMDFSILDDVDDPNPSMHCPFCDKDFKKWVFDEITGAPKCLVCGERLETPNAN